MKEYIIELSDDENALSILVKAYNLHELIRCKDCKHYDSFSQECRDGIDGIMTPDFYCANGKHKEGR